MSEQVRDRAPSRGLTIMLAEDDLALATMLRDALEPRGHRIWHAQTAAEAIFLLGEVDPDVILVDLMLPDAHGLTLCVELRQRTEAPIIVCSATKRQDDAVLALKLGATDFVAKPFYLPELEARIEAAWRRGRSRGGATTARPSAEGGQRIGGMVIDRASRSVVVSGQTVHLTPIEYRLLDLLAARAGQALSREELVKAVWGSDDPALLESLAVHARRLRGKLTRGQPDAPSIVTVRGFGYQIR